MSCYTFDSGEHTIEPRKIRGSSICRDNSLGKYDFSVLGMVSVFFLGIEIFPRPTPSSAAPGHRPAPAFENG